MDIKRTSFSKAIDSMILLFTIIMLTAIMLFFFNIDSETVSWTSIVLSLSCSSVVAGFIIEKYSSKFPFRLTIKDERVTIYKFLSKKEIFSKDISQVLEINSMSNFTGSITYEVYYNDQRILLNSKRFSNLDKFISKLSKHI